VSEQPSSPSVSPVPFTCPVIQEAQNILAMSGNLTRAMRRLRKKMNRCSSCEFAGACPEMRHFQSQIITAIVELTDEWNLVP
jgi:hypothetical protein